MKLETTYYTFELPNFKSNAYYMHLHSGSIDTGEGWEATLKECAQEEINTIITDLLDKAGNPTCENDIKQIESEAIDQYLADSSFEEVQEDQEGNWISI